MNRRAPRMTNADLNKPANSFTRLPRARVNGLGQEFAGRTTMPLAASAQSAGMPLKEAEA